MIRKIVLGLLCLLAFVHEVFPADKLVAAPWVSGGGWHSTLYVVNTSTLIATLYIETFNQDGSLGISQLAQILPEGILKYTSPDSDNFAVGFAVIERVHVVDQINIAGILVIRLGKFEAALPLLPEPGRISRVLFDDAEYQIALALANVSTDVAEIKLVIHNEDGNIMSMVTLFLQPGEYVGNFLYQLFPNAGNPLRKGLLMITSSIPIFSNVLQFGPDGMFAAVPSMRGPPN